MGEALLSFFEDIGRWLSERRRGIARAAALIVLIAALPLAALALLPTVLSTFAPPLDPHVDLYTVNRPLAFTFLDTNGHEVGHRGAIIGDRLHLAEMPPYLPAAFIAMEDRRFYEHHGIDVRGLVRASLANIKKGHVVAGGSTITQQTAKIVFTSQERTLARKWTELFEAAQLEKSLSKTQILELYLNRIYLGSGAYGVDGAAHVYFNKSARELTLPEAAMLATLTRAPSVFSPRRDLAKAQTRATRVLNTMVETGAIGEKEAAAGIAAPAQVADRGAMDSRNFYLDTAADEAMKRATVNGVAPTSDLIVHTTLEPHIEDAARNAALKTLRKSGRKMHASEAAVVVMKTDGAVVALLGGTDYAESTFNRATQAHRQPGSAFKPFVYLAALEAGLTPWDVRDDEPVDIDGWTPTNFGGRSYGTLTLADALAHSVNTITANLAQEVGISTIVDAAARCGIQSPLEQNASLALGTSEVTPIELTTAYAAFASGGYAVEPYFVTEVDRAGGQVLWRRTAPEPQRIIAEHVDKDLVAMLYGVVTEGTGRGASLTGHEAAGKTGTTQDYHDAWFVGFTADYVASVWIGNDDSTPMKSVTGGSLPAQIWRSVMTEAEKGKASTPLDKSSPQAPVTDVDTMLDASGSEPVTTGDDESGNAAVSMAPDASADREQHEREARPRSDRRNFFDWLFGRDESRRTPPPPPPPSVAQPADPNADQEREQRDDDDDDGN
ncbi:MAG: PBP1A family penicillin-binding protein [Alphaproteobacteria bacterium]|nr:PBP1A family penicillin-binding protein [Alphaproteobacteria bacterium]